MCPSRTQWRRSRRIAARSAALIVGRFSNRAKSTAKSPCAQTTGKGDMDAPACGAPWKNSMLKGRVRCRPLTVWRAVIASIRSPSRRRTAVERPNVTANRSPYPPDPPPSPTTTASGAVALARPAQRRCVLIYPLPRGISRPSCRAASARQVSSVSPPGGHGTTTIASPPRCQIEPIGCRAETVAPQGRHTASTARHPYATRIANCPCSK